MPFKSYEVGMRRTLNQTILIIKAIESQSPAWGPVTPVTG
jgi:hypothetical protein